MVIRRLSMLACLLTLALLLNTVALAQEGTPPVEPPTNTPTLEPPPPPTETPPPPPTETPLPTATETPIPTNTETPVPTMTPTDTETATWTPTETATNTAETTPETTAETTETPTFTLSPTGTETATETPTATATPDEMILLYADNFDALTLSAWFLGVDWIHAPVEYGALRAYPPMLSETQFTLSETQFILSDLFNVSAQARFYIEEGFGGLAVRRSEVGTYKVLVNVSGQVDLYRGEVIVQSATVPTSPDGWYTITLSAINNLVRVAVNGVETLVFADDAMLPPGAIVFTGDENALLLVDDFALHVPSADFAATSAALSAAIQNSQSAAVPLSVPAVAQVESAGGGQIAFATRCGSSYKIAIIDPVRTGCNIYGLLRFIDIPNVVERSPELSPDGSRVTFIWDRTGTSGHRHLFVVNIDGSGLRQLTQGTQIPSIGSQWSPDGSQIVFATGFYIYVIDVETGATLHQWSYLQSHTVESVPTWSPDGSRIAYVLRQYTAGGAYFLAVLDMTNSDPYSAQFFYNFSPGLPVWSPIDNRLAYLLNNNIYYVNVDVTPFTPVQVTNDGTAVLRKSRFDWSPDGSQIVYTVNFVPTPPVSSDSALYMVDVNADGSISPSMQLTDWGFYYDRDPSWGARAAAVLPPPAAGECQAMLIALPEDDENRRRPISTSDIAILSNVNNQLGVLDPGVVANIYDQDALPDGTPVIISAIHPNRLYAQVKYIDGEGNLQEGDLWIRIRTQKIRDTFALISVTDGEGCTTGDGAFTRDKVEELISHTLELNLLPECQTGQGVDCRPPAASSCQPNSPFCVNPPQDPPLHVWRDTADGCSRSRCDPDPCPAWDDGNDNYDTELEQSHCGIDLVVTGDNRGSEHNDADPTALLPLRSTYTFVGANVTSDIITNHLNSGTGIYCTYSPDGFTYHFRQRVRVDQPYQNADGTMQGTEPAYQIWEYQYTHFNDDGDEILPYIGASTDMTGYYVPPGLLFDSYDLAGNSGATAHVHLVIVIYANYSTENLCSASIQTKLTYINPFTLTINLQG